MAEWLTQADLSVLVWMREHLANPAMDTLMKGITSLGNAGFLWIVMAFAFICYRPLRKKGLTMLLALAAVFVCGEVLIKAIVERPRPFIRFPEFSLIVPPPRNYSFPSSHACTSIAAACVLFERRKVWTYLPLLAAALIAFSRVYLCVHYPSDVLAGAALGVAFGLGARFLMEKRKANMNNL